MNKAFLFPGQGSQAVSMGKAFYENFQVAKDTFEYVDEILKYKLSSIIFNGPLEELTLTTNTQNALMAVSIAIINTIKNQSGKSIEQLCSFVAGHSLGEYSALCSAESLSLEDTAKLLYIRGSSMQSACPIGVGAMAACIGINIADLEDILKITKSSGVCEIANDNIDGQIVISGHTESVDRVIAILQDTGYRAIKLNVTAPFHSSLMKPAEEKMQAALSNTKIHTPKIPIIANVDAIETIDSSKIMQNLLSQVCGRVKWRDTLSRLEELGVDTVVEIGAGKVLTGMLKKTSHTFKTFNISNLTELDQFIHQL